MKKDSFEESGYLSKAKRYVSDINVCNTHKMFFTSKKRFDQSDTVFHFY